MEYGMSAADCDPSHVYTLGEVGEVDGTRASNANDLGGSQDSGEE